MKVCLIHLTWTSLMKISKVVGYCLSSPYGDGKTFGQPAGVKSIGMVEVHTDSNVIGIGETYSGIYLPELIGPITNSLADLIVGYNPMEIDRIYDLLNIPFFGSTGIVKSVISAIDIALWDIKGQVLEKPIYQLLNDSVNNDVKVYASGGSVTFSTVEIQADIEKILKKGYHAYKMRIGYKSWEEDLERVRTARECLGNNYELMIDAIMGTLKNPWNKDIALNKIEDLKEFDPYWVEEPLHPTDLSGYRYLKEKASAKIAVGEAFCSAHEFEAYFDAVDFIQPDVTNCGGFSSMINIINAAKSNDIPVALHVWGSAVSILANLHIACVFSNVEWFEMPQVRLDIFSDYISRLITIDNGYISAPETVGLGISINEQIKKEYRFVLGSGYKVPVTTNK